jgi:hypothetical protein
MEMGYPVVVIIKPDLDPIRPMVGMNSLPRLCS